MCRYKFAHRCYEGQHTATIPVQSRETYTLFERRSRTPSISLRTGQSSTIYSPDDMFAVPKVRIDRVRGDGRQLDRRV